MLVRPSCASAWFCMPMFKGTLTQQDTTVNLAVTATFVCLSLRSEDERPFSQQASEPVNSGTIKEEAEDQPSQKQTHLLRRLL